VALRGYVKKGRPALWQTAFPDQIRPNKPKSAKSIKRTPIKRTQTRIKPVSDTKASERRLYAKEARKFVSEAVGRGERCPVVASIADLRDGNRYGWPISDKLTEIHHSRGRLGSLLRDQRFWIAMSKAGHRWVHSNIPEARQRGWICEAGQWNKSEI
jgi:hypothetical protein